MHARNLLLVALTVFQAIIQSSFCSKSSSSEENLRYEEPRTSSSPVEKRKSRREESISSSKRSAKEKSAKQKKASFEYSRRRSPGGTDVVDIFKTESYRDRRDCPLKSSWIASCEVHQRLDRAHQRFAKYLLCESQIDKIKNELSTADSWNLPQVFDACKRVRLINGQGEQESCHFCDLLWLGWKCWRIFKSERPLKSDW